MGTDGDDPEPQRARLAWMISEFEEARRRRLVKPGVGVVDADTTADTTADTKDAPAKPTVPHS